MRLTSLLLFLTLATHAATYYVTPTGSDVGAGSQASPWLTIQHAVNVAVAGDTVNISSGTYPEYVTSAVAGSAGSRIVVQANATNTSPVTLREFRVEHRFIVLNGLVFAKGNSINNAAIRVEAPSASYNGSDCVITNCILRDTPVVLTRTATFGSNYIRIASAYEGVDFNTAGFTNGSAVFLGADSLYAYTNHGTAHTVLSNSVDGLTMYFNDTLPADSGTYWAAIISGGDNQAYKGVLADIGASVGASNLTVVNCTFTNLFGPALIFAGSNASIQSNRFTRLHGQYAMQIQGSSADVGYNTILDSPNIEWFTPGEISGAQHPAGATYYDWQCNVTASFAPGVTNVDFHHNWIQNCDNQLTMIEAQLAGAAPNHDYKIRYCVFVGLYTGSFSRSGITFDHCTFYRNAYTLEETVPVAIGGTANSDLGVLGGQIQTGLVVTANAFIDNGEHATPGNEYPFGITSTTNYVITNNLSIQAETMGWVGTATQVGILTNTIGDPLLLNARNPLGPDGLAFTADDGLRPLPNSPMATLGLGALSVMPTNNPIAHFAVKLPSPGWKDKTGTNYDLTWAANRPDARGGLIRPWGTAEAIGTTPVTVSFDASGSVDGMGTTTNTGIVSYTWDFGDGKKVASVLPKTLHTFTRLGTNTITLTVTNSSGASSVFVNSYRVLAPSPAFYVSTTGNDTTGDGSSGNPWRTIQKGINTATNGVTVIVQPGIYAERLTLNTTASATNPITIVANGAVTNTCSWKFNTGAANIIVSGFDGDFSGANKETSPILFDSSGVSNITVVAFSLHDVGNIYPYAAIDFNTLSGGGTNLDSSVAISNCAFANIATIMVSLRGSNHIVMGNTFSNSWGSDALGVWGHDHIVRGNFASQIGSGFVAIYGAGNAAFNGCYYDNLPLRTARGHAIWTNAAGYAVFQDSSFASDGYSNTFSIINTVSTNPIYASAAQLNGPWTMWNATIVSAPTNGIGSVEHPDFIQTFGVYAGGTNAPNYGQISYNILIERNTVVDGVGGAICQLESNNGNLPSDFHDWTFQDNVFANIELGASITMLRCKWFNNTFYRCAPNTGSLSFGWVDPNSADPRGSSDGSACSNNAFIACAYLTSSPGAYSGTSNGVQMLNLYTNCDYNFVCKTDFTAQSAATVYPTTDPFRFYEPHGINGGDPKLANAAAEDLRITTGSVLVGKGAAISANTFDLGGITWSNPPDIGAYAYAVSGQTSGGGGGSVTNPPPGQFRAITMSTGVMRVGP